MNRKKRIRRRLRLLAVLLLSLAAAFLARCRYLPFLREAARARVVNTASDHITAAINGQIASGQIHYENIICLEKNTNGEITALRTNMAEVNRLKTLTVELLSQELLEMDTEELSIQLGSILMPEFFAGKGPGLPIRVVALSTADAEFFSEFVSAGINQTLHRLNMIVSVDVSVLVMGETDSFTIHSEVVVAETVIIGEVPSTYLQTGGYYGSQREN